MRRRAVLLAALAAVGMGMGTFGTAEAEAHGSCGFSTLSLFKSNGMIVGRAAMSCDVWHRSLTVRVQIERLAGGTWVTASPPGVGTGSGREVGAETSTPCVVSGTYRLVASGSSSDETSPSPHIVQHASSSRLFTCP